MEDVHGDLKDVSDAAHVGNVADVNHVDEPSVTRFDEFLPIGHNLNRLWHFVEGLFTIWKKSEPVYFDEFFLLDKF